MGFKWEVYAYVFTKSGVYDFEEVYYGQSAARAIWAAVRAKMRGVGYVKIEWR